MKYSLLAQLGINTKAYENGLAVAQKQTQGFAKKIGNTLRNIALTFGGFNLAKKFIELGMASKETASMFDTVFADSLDRMKNELKELKRVIPETEINIKNALATFRQMANGFGLTGESANDFAIQLVKVGSDFASFRNLRVEDMFVKLRSAVAGMSRPMMDLGINTQNTILEQEAFSRGIEITSGKLTPAQKAFLVLATTVKQMGVVMGDQERTNQSTANQFKHLQTRALNLGAEIGEKLLPHFVNLLDFANKTIDAFTNMGKGTQNLIKNIGKGIVFFKAYKIAMKGVAMSVAVFSGVAKLLTGRLGATVTASKVATTSMKAQTIATNTATVATGRLNGMLIALRANLLRTGVGVAVIMLGEYIMKAYEARTATNDLGDSTEGLADQAQEQIKIALGKMNDFQREAQLSGQLNPFEGTIDGGYEAIDTTQELSAQIGQYFNLVKQKRNSEFDAGIKRRELLKDIKELEGDKEGVKVLEEQIEVLKEAKAFAERYGFSLEYSIRRIKELRKFRKESPEQKLLDKQEEKTKRIADMELELLKAKARGQEELAKRMEERIRLEKEALRISQDHNIELDKAFNLARNITKQEQSQSDLARGQEMTGGKSTSIKKVANEIGKEMGVRFQREKVGGETMFRRFKDGKREGLFSEEQMKEAIGKKDRELEEKGDEKSLEKLEEIRKALEPLEGKFVNE